MKIPRKHSSHGYSLAELTVSAAIAGILGAGLLLYSSTTMRMVSRNLATNHSHEAVRGSIQRFLSDLHEASSDFTLVTYNGTTYSDVTPASSTNQDSYSGFYISNAANGVRFMTVAGGPYKIIDDGSGNTTIPSTTTTLKFEFGVDSNGEPSHGGKLPYIPRLGDKVQIPLISREFDIVGVTPPTSSNTYGTVTLGNITSSPNTPGTTPTTYTTTALGFTLYTVGPTPAGVASPVVTATFYKRVGYVVYNNQLSYLPNYPPAVAGDTLLLRTNITSPKPFALLFPTSASANTDGLNLRVSLEAYDTQYSARLFTNGTTTLQAVIPSRTQPQTLSTD